MRWFWNEQTIYCGRKDILSLNQRRKSARQTIASLWGLRDRWAPLLDEEKLNKYKDMKVMARGNKALAFFFYKNMGLSVTTKLIICRIFRAYLKEMRTVSHENIFIYVKRLDSGWNRSYHYLSKIIMCIRRVVTFSYKFKTNFPKIKLNTKRKPKVEVSLVTPNQILLTHKMLLKMKNREYALLLRMM